MLLGCIIASVSAFVKSINYLQAHYKIPGQRRRETHLHPKLIRLVRFAFRETFHFGGMHAVELALVLALLREESLDAA